MVIYKCIYEEVSDMKMMNKMNGGEYDRNERLVGDVS